MVITDKRNELGSKVPALGEQTSAVTMGKAHGALLRLMQGNAFDFPGLPSGTKFLRQEPKIDDDSQVMEQTRKVCFPGIAEIDFAREMARDQRASQGVLPEDHRIQAAFIARQHVQYATRHGDIADVMEAQADDCSAQRLHIL